jgi:hypothetical protein
MASAARGRPRSPLATDGLLSLPDLTLAPGMRFPYRQELRSPIGNGPDLVPPLSANLRAQGYRVGVLPSEGTGARNVREWEGALPLLLAERAIRRVRMLRPMRVFIYTLFGGVLVLGAFDFVAVGNPIVLAPWALSAATIAFLFWHRWGRSYLSDVVVVTWQAGRADPTAGPPRIPLLVWWSGRIRSDVRGSVRLAVGVEAVNSLAGDLAQAAQRYAAQAAAA